MIIPDKIIRSNRKTLSVSIDHFGAVTVRAPRRCEEKRIFAFLSEKEDWIRRKQAEIKGAGMALPPENLDGYSFLLLGKPCEIVVDEGKRVRFDAEEYKLYLPKENAKERLLKWLKENAKRILSSLTESKAREMGTAYRSVSVTSAKTRWGSCSYHNALHYSFRVLYAPREVIEYIVVHELAHTKHKDHSKAFWDFVQAFVPDWREKRKWLKTHGVLMEIF